eukprot:scaffold10606_cov84-Skeletonema_marinoi.AAC.3
MPSTRLCGCRSSLNNRGKMTMDLPMKKRRMAEKILMAPSGGCGGGSEATAFVSPPANRGRTIISSLHQSSASSAATSCNDENNNKDSIFSSRGGHQSHLSTEIQQKQRVLRPDEPNLYDLGMITPYPHW